MVSTSEFKKGLKIVYKGEPYEIIDFQHVKMQQRAPIVRTKIKNLKTGRVLEENFSSGDKFEKPELEEGKTIRIYVSFVIEKDGSIKRVIITKNVDPILDFEAVRIIASMPQWQPASSKGKAIASMIVLPINFAMRP